MSRKKTIGWIGLGEMGLGMARSALRAGHDVTGHTRGRPEHDRLIDDGGKLSRDVLDVIAGKDAVCINVFDGAQVEDVLYAQGVLAALSPGTVLILHTTSAPQIVIQAAERLPPGVAIVDGAFSGTPLQALQGKLTVMAGGDPVAFAQAEPVLASFASYLRHVGPVGFGMRVKLINNMLLGAHAALASDAIRLADESGIAADILVDVVTRSSGASAAMGLFAGTDIAAVMAALRPYLEKDVACAMAAAESEGLNLRTLAETASMFMVT